MARVDMNARVMLDKAIRDRISTKEDCKVDNSNLKAKIKEISQDLSMTNSKITGFDDRIIDQ